MTTRHAVRNFAAILFAALAVTLEARAVEPPAEQRVVASTVFTDDVTRFWDAYDRIVAAKDKEERAGLLQTLFLKKASPGQMSMIQARRYRASEYLDAIERFPKFYASIRANMLRAPEYAKAIAAGIERLRGIYPVMKPADVYFTVGVFRSGGTALNGHVLLGCENALADASTDTSEFPESMAYLKTHFATNPNKEVVFLSVHEYIHTQQSGHGGVDLLSQCLYEGIAEFVTTVALDRPSPNTAVIYGLANREKVREVFEEELYSRWWYNWLWNDSNNAFRTRDVGYAAGFMIAEAYYQRSEDKKKAIAELIELDCTSSAAVDRIAEKSGWFSKPLSELRAAFERRRPRVVEIVEFKNGQRDVDPGLTSITFRFSEAMDTDMQSTGAGELGLDHFPQVSSRKFAEDGRSITYAVSLKPATHYQMVLESGYRNGRAIQLVPHAVEFWTR